MMLTAGTAAAQTDPLVPIIPKALNFAAEQMRRNVSDFGDSVQYPRSTYPDGKWKTVSRYDWTSGFFPGCLWYVYEYSHDPFFKAAAQRWTDGLARIQYFHGNHDVGFMMFNSYGHAYRLIHAPESKAILLQSARSLMLRYSPAVGCIKSWDNPKWQYPVIMDNMMNLELLFWASKNGGTRDMYDASVSHAAKSMQNHVRADGSTYHVVSYDSITGAVDRFDTHQGYSKTSTWSRGQAWAIYGFTMVYRFTKEERFLETARRGADYFIRNLPDDYVPYWDFQAENIPDEPRDASAAAIAASGLLELSQFVHDGTAAKKYWNTARSILLSLCTPAYSAKGTASHGLINHCVTSKPADSEIDVSLIYGDYYFIEALLRYRSFQNPAFRNSTN